jgi:phosphomevalonate decarboxylase
MQGLVKYHGLRDWNLRIPYHDSISVNTDCLFSETTVGESPGGSELILNGHVDSQSLKRAAPVLERISGKAFNDLKLRIESKNRPVLKAKGVGFSSSAGAALTLSAFASIKSAKPDLDELSKVARLFAASSARSIVGGFSRLYAGKGDSDSVAVRFAGKEELDLRMVIVPLPSRAKTEEAHREVETSPFFKARIESAQKRCEEMEKAILGNDFHALGVLTERDTLELHSITMTGASRMIIMTADTIKVIEKVRELRGAGTDAYFSMQTGPSVFINTTDRHQSRVLKSIKRMGYVAIPSSVGEGAELLN